MMQAYRVYAGNMYVGKLFVDRWGHLFRDRHGNLIVSSTCIQRIKRYKQLQLIRTNRGV